MSKRFQFLFRQSAPYIHGQFVSSSNGPRRQLINPVNEKVLCEYEETTMTQLDAALLSSHSVLGWDDPKYRRDCLLKLADQIARHDHDLAWLESQQTGKSVADALDEITDSVDCFRHFAGYCDKPLGTALGMSSWTIREPIGVVALITSFNYPLMLAGWKLAPALAAGNCALLRPAPQTPLTSLALAELSTLPAGVLNVLPGGNIEVSQALIERADMTSFTGSTRVGQEIMTRNVGLKPLVLECGGKNTVIVCKDADLDLAAVHIAGGAFSNAGQNCCAASRVLVHHSVHDAFLVCLQKHLECECPIIDSSHYARIKKIMADYPEKPVMVGLKKEQGYFVPPTVYAHVEDNASIAQEEIFGPVLCILNPFDEVEEAIERANGTKYGLAAGVFSQNYQQAQKIAQTLKAGTVWINTYNSTNNALPFGGTKLSGLGKDLGKSALDSFTFEKTVMIAPSP
ncbi:aldehyde dehydrogenase domain-containing protein [Sporodiniella umbellata]|nr:aldehyde dehydrogenase domain-containing protein [Sporodiniella umbellata]